MADIQYKANHWNRVFHSLPHDIVFGAGAAGVGKSLSLLIDPMIQVKAEDERCRDKHHPFHQRWGMSTGEAWHMRRVGEDLDQTIERSKRLFPTIDAQADYNENKKAWRFRSGYKYVFESCNKPDDWNRFRSNQCTHLGMDELIEFTQKQYDEIQTRVRSSDPVLIRMLRWRMCSNPSVPASLSKRGIKLNDPLWVRKMFVDPEPNGKVTFRRRVKRDDGTYAERTWIYWPGTLYDNPDPDFVKVYEANLLLAKPHIRAAQLYGDWYITAGSYFGAAWKKGIHTREPFQVPSRWPKWRSMDWGFKKHGCVHWWAMDEEGNIFCIYELTFIGRHDEDVAKDIKRIETDVLRIPLRDGRSALSGPADTQIWEERGRGTKTIGSTMWENGVDWEKADKKSRRRNAELMYKRLEDHQDGTCTPGIVISTRCRRLIQTLPAAMEDSDTGELVDGGDDHWLDSALYSVAYASHGRVGIRWTSQEDWERQRRRGTVSRRAKGSYGSEI